MSKDNKINERLEKIEHLQYEMVEELHKIKAVLDLVVKSDTLSNKALILLIDKIENVIKKEHPFNDDIMVV